VENDNLLEDGIDAFNRGDYVASVGILQTALTQLRSTAKPDELGLCIYYLESSAAFSEDRDVRKVPIQEALELFRQTDLHYLAASCCMQLAELLAISNAQVASDLLTEARTHFQHCENWTGQARAFRVEAKLSADRGAKEGALHLIDQALRLINEQPQGLETVKSEKRQIERFRSMLLQVS